MARPAKAKRICGMPSWERFGPLDESAGKQGEMTLEEYEAIRLIDYLDCTQEECAAQMGVARTTVQAVYQSARKKLAVMVVEGGCLSISGGSYEICPGAAGCCKKDCGKRTCPKRRCGGLKYDNGGCDHEGCGNL